MRAMLAVVASIALAVLSWGSYIPVLHKGQAAMEGSRLRPFICVGLAYFAIAVIVPLAVLIARGEKGRWTPKGLIFSLAGGTVGALGALGVILAQNSGGNPLFVIPLIFGCAPVVNTFVTMYLHKNYKEVGPLFLAGLILVVTGAVTVLIFNPKASSAGSLNLPVLGWVACTVLCWGTYGPILHKGQAAMSGSRLRPFLCVGVAYIVIAVVIPFALLGTGAEADAPSGTLTVRPASSGSKEIVQLTVTTVGSEGPEPAAGATVYLGEERIGATDDSGEIELAADRAKDAGAFRVSKEGYRDFSSPLDLDGHAELGVTLKHEPAWTAAGIRYSLAGGAAGALGALGIILAFNFGGKPVYVMPLVFGGAPVVGTIISLVMAGGKTPSPFFFAGLIVVAVGAVTVLVFAPKPHPHAVPTR
jgi:hypothetical protein